MLAVVEDDKRRRSAEHGTEFGKDIGVVSGTTGVVENQVGEHRKHRFADSDARQVSEPGACQRKRKRLGEAQAQRGLADTTRPDDRNQPPAVKQLRGVRSAPHADPRTATVSGAKSLA